MSCSIAHLGFGLVRRVRRLAVLSITGHKQAYLGRGAQGGATWLIAIFRSYVQRLFLVLCRSGSSSSCASFMAFMQASNSVLPNAMAEQSFFLLLFVRLHISRLDVFPLSLQVRVRACVHRSKGFKPDNTYALVPGVPHRVCCSFKSPATCVSFIPGSTPGSRSQFECEGTEKDGRQPGGIFSHQATV